jgi:hypothetical protein
MDTDVVSDGALPSHLASATRQVFWGIPHFKRSPKKFIGLAQDKHGRALARRQRLNFRSSGESR